MATIIYVPSGGTLPLRVRSQILKTLSAALIRKPLTGRCTGYSKSAEQSKADKAFGLAVFYIVFLDDSLWD